MLKRILLAALVWPLVALAQSYPSPTFNNVTVNGTLTAATPSFTNPLPVGSGGTGVSSITQYNVVVGAGSALGFVGPGVSGALLASNGATSYPSFQTLSALGIATLASPTFTGTVTLPSGTALVSPALSGTPTAPTAAAGTNTTQIATTANVVANFATPPTAGYGSTTAEPVNATTINSTTSGSTHSITVTDTGSAGANVELSGNGGTTPAKWIRAQGGSLQVVNNAYSSNILGLTDAGNLSVTGSIAPSTMGGIVGTTLGDNANAGSVGEYQTAQTTGTSVSSSTPANSTSISLTAGDWDVTSITEFVPAGSTTTSLISTGISTTSANYQIFTGSFLNAQSIPVSIPAGVASYLVAPVTRISVSSTTTVYAVCTATFATSTMTVNGFIRARRVR